MITRLTDLKDRSSSLEGRSKNVGSHPELGQRINVIGREWPGAGEPRMITRLTDP
jgi:hypothetical protein